MLALCRLARDLLFPMAYTISMRFGHRICTVKTASLHMWRVTLVQSSIGKLLDNLESRWAGESWEVMIIVSKEGAIRGEQFEVVDVSWKQWLVSPMLTRVV